MEFTLERWNRCSSQTRAKLVFKSFHCHQQRDRLRPACVHINYSKYFPVSAEHSFLPSLSQQLGNTHIYLQTMKGILQIPKGIKYNFFLQGKLKKLTAFAQFGCWLLRTEASMKLIISSLHSDLVSGEQFQCHLSSVRPMLSVRTVTGPATTHRAHKQGLALNDGIAAKLS